MVTDVPFPGSLSIRISPPCSSTRLLTIDNPRPAPRCLEPWLRETNRSSTLRCWSFGNPHTLVDHGEGDLIAIAPARQLHLPARHGKANGVREQIVEDLAHAGFIGDEFQRVGSDGDVERDAGATGAIAHAEDRGIDDRLHLDR